MRHHLTIDCGGDRLAATCDMPDHKPNGALLVVSGGREPRCGPHASMARLGASLAAHGIATLRFDRRGIGDSTGADPGYANAVADIGAALRHLRSAVPAGTRVVGFGNCDAATALALSGLPFDGLVLANPWTLSEDAADHSPALPPPAAIRARYAARLRDPAVYARAMRGGIDWRKLARGLVAARPRLGQSTRPAAPALARRLANGIASCACPVGILVAEGDRTAQHFLADCAPHLAADAPIVRRASASHGFAGPGDAEWLRDQLIAACAR